MQHIHSIYLLVDSRCWMSSLDGFPGSENAVVHLSVFGIVNRVSNVVDCVVGCWFDVTSKLVAVRELR